MAAKVDSPAYDTAKAGVIRLTTTLAWLNEKENIRVNCLAPGWIASGDVRSYWESLTPEQRIERRAPSRLLQLDEVADAVTRLATNETFGDGESHRSINVANRAPGVATLRGEQSSEATATSGRAADR
jgi:NAD(P)-dependent dehydrogenase (short-subunit alcohol dehydrogenase family)